MHVFQFAKIYQINCFVLTNALFFYFDLLKSLTVTDDDGQIGDKINQTKVSLTNSLTDVNEDLINGKNNEIGRVTKWATGFEKLLEDPLGLKIFTVNNS